MGQPSHLTGSLYVTGSITASLGFDGLSDVFSASAQVDHDAATNFVANEHIDHTSVSITGTGALTGGGNIDTSRTITLDANSGTFKAAVTSSFGGTGIVSSSTQMDTLFNLDGVMSSSAQVDHDNTTNFAANEHFTQASITTVGTIGTGVWQGTAVDTAYLDTTLTSQTSILNASLVTGRDADNQIKYSTDDEIIFRVAGADGVTMKASGDTDIDGHITLPSDKKVNFGANAYIEGATSGTKLMLKSSAETIFQPGGSTKVTFESDGSANFTGAISSSNIGPRITSGAADMVDGEIVIAVGKNAVTSSDAFAVDSDGNIGIGTSSPAVRLHMVGDGAQTSQFRMEQYNDTTDAVDIRTKRGRGTAASPADIQTGDYLFRLNVEGRDGGSMVNYASLQFDVDGSDQDACIYRIMTRGAAGGSEVQRYLIDGESNHRFFGNATVSGSLIVSSSIGDSPYGILVKGAISASGDVIAYQSSDERLKDNIQPIESPLEKVSKINGVTFDWNDKQDLYQGRDIGVIAQEIETVLPEIVQTRETGMKAIRYEKIVALLIEAIKEQQLQIDELKNRL